MGVNGGVFSKGSQSSTGDDLVSNRLDHVGGADDEGNVHVLDVGVVLRAAEIEVDVFAEEILGSGGCC